MRRNLGVTEEAARTREKERGMPGVRSQAVTSQTEQAVKVRHTERREGKKS